MKIVSTTAVKPKIGLDMLVMRKAELKKQIKEQQFQIATSARQLVSPASLSDYLFSGLKRSMNLMDGLLIGFKLARTITKLFKRK